MLYGVTEDNRRVDYILPDADAEWTAAWKAELLGDESPLSERGKMSPEAGLFEFMELPPNEMASRYPKCAKYAHPTSRLDFSPEK